MAKTVEEYLDASMYVGQRIRYDDCPFCGEKVRGKGFVVTRTKNGFFLWCFRCHAHRHLTRDGLSLSSVKRYMKARDNSHETTEETTVQHSIVTLPPDFTTEIPTAGLMWLRKGNVTDEEIRSYRFGYSPSLDRVILPVWGDEGLLYWQGRALKPGGRTPKYINVTTKRKSVYFVVQQNSDTTVLVEDILSALAVARAGGNAIALLGSHVAAGVREFIKTRKVRVWLDPDKRKECVRFAKMLSAQALIAVPIVYTTKDPKEYTTEEIQSIIFPNSSTRR